MARKKFFNSIIKGLKEVLEDAKRNSSEPKRKSVTKGSVGNKCDRSTNRNTDNQNV